MAKRIAKLIRNTSETKICVKLNLDGQGKSKIDTGIQFLDHMLTLFSRHGLFDLELKAKGDLGVDIHHTNEDIGISLGEAFKKTLQDKKRIKRFGFAYVPMDETLARVVVDISGRPYLSFKAPNIRHTGARSKYQEPCTYTLNYAKQFLQAFVANSNTTIHIDILYGEDTHHILEAIFKAFGLAFSQSVRINPRIKGVPSTKGTL